jgi:uncharacterized protein YeaO (DUF488 family)
MRGIIRAAETEGPVTIRIVRLGSPRTKGEGLRLGTVRRPPRGVPKSEFATRDFYDVWLPLLSPDPELVKAWLNAPDDTALAACRKRFLAQMKAPDAAHLLDLLAALSHQTSFSLGCYCTDPARCHRSVLRDLLIQRGAIIE